MVRDLASPFDTNDEALRRESGGQTAALQKDIADRKSMRQGVDSSQFPARKPTLDT